MTRLCLYVVGEPPPDVAATRGGYPEIFAPLVERSGGRVEAIDGRVSDPDLDGFDGVIITGSSASLVQREPWMDRAVALVRGCFRREKPLLGVCFGHQLIGEAAGGRVIANPRGWEISSRTVQLTDAGRGDPLFTGLPESITVNFSHSDIVDAASLSAEVTVLARNDKAEVQALAWGPHVRGVQFHPEFDGALVRALIDHRADELDVDALARGADDERPDPLRQRARDTADGEQVLHNFLAGLQAR